MHCTWRSASLESRPVFKDMMLEVAEIMAQHHLLKTQETLPILPLQEGIELILSDDKGALTETEYEATLEGTMNYQQISHL